MKILFAHGSNTPLLAAFEKKKPGTDTPLLAAGWFIFEYAVGILFCNGFYRSVLSGLSCGESEMGQRAHLDALPDSSYNCIISAGESMERKAFCRERKREELCRTERNMTWKRP